MSHLLSLYIYPAIYIFDPQNTFSASNKSNLGKNHLGNGHFSLNFDIIRSKSINVTPFYGGVNVVVVFIYKKGSVDFIGSLIAKGRKLKMFLFFLP